MSNKFEKRSGFEHVNIKTSQTPVKSKQAYYVSVYYSFSDDGHFARIEQVDYNNPWFMEWNVTTVWNEPKTEGDPKTNGIASKDKGEQNGRI